jgi:peptide/nickel transport system substrate-binding protein
VRLANLRSGSLDMMERVLATDIKTVRDSPKLRLSKAVSIGWFGLLVNVANGPASDNPLGKDRACGARSISASTARRSTRSSTTASSCRATSGSTRSIPTTSRSFPVPKRDLAKAKALLKEAGVTGRIPIDFMVGNTPEVRAVAEVVQSMARKPGFDLKIRVTEVATALKEGESGKFQLYQNTWSGRIDPDGNSIIYQACGAPQNMGTYCDKEVDALHEQARATSDPAKRKAIYEKLTRSSWPAAGSSTSITRST